VTQCNRLGNLVLLETNRNKSLANAAYASKRPALTSSAITNTRQLVERFETWTPGCPGHPPGADGKSSHRHLAREPAGVCCSILASEGEKPLPPIAAFHLMNNSTSSPSPSA